MKTLWFVDIMSLIPRSGSDDAEADQTLRENTVANFIDMLEQPYISDMLAQTMCWVWTLAFV